LKRYFAAIKTTSLIYSKIEYGNHQIAFEIMINTIPTLEIFLMKLKDFKESNIKILVFKFDKFDPIQNQHLNS
jgi:hypothetical protein